MLHCLHASSAGLTSHRSLDRFEGSRLVKSVQGGLLEKILAVGRGHANARYGTLAHQGHRDFDPRGAGAPDFPEEIGKPADPSARDLDHDVAHLYTGALSGSAAREPRNHDMPFHFRRIKAEPGAGGPPRSAELHQVLEDRLEQVDRYDHVALHGAPAQFLLNHQGADPEEPPANADERCAAPMGMRRGGEERFIQYILPVAGKLSPRDELGLERMLAASVTGYDDVVADPARSCSPP